MCAKFFEGFMKDVSGKHPFNGNGKKARGRGSEDRKNYCGRKALIRVLKISVSVIVTTVKSLLGQKCKGLKKQSGVRLRKETH